MKKILSMILFLLTSCSSNITTSSPKNSEIESSNINSDSLVYSELLTYESENIEIKESIDEEYEYQLSRYKLYPSEVKENIKKATQGYPIPFISAKKYETSLYNIYNQDVCKIQAKDVYNKDKSIQDYTNNCIAMHFSTYPYDESYGYIATYKQDDFTIIIQFNYIENALEGSVFTLYCYLMDSQYITITE